MNWNLYRISEFSRIRMFYIISRLCSEILIYPKWKFVYCVSFSSLYLTGTLPPYRSSRVTCWSWHVSITQWEYVMMSRGEWGPNRNCVKPSSSTTQGRTGTTTTVKASRTSLCVRWRSGTPCLGVRTVGSCWPYTTTRCMTWQAATTQRPALTNVCRRRLPPAPRPACLATCTTCGNSWPCLYGTIN